jgi:hypothetical protein
MDELCLGLAGASLCGYSGKRPISGEMFSLGTASIGRLGLWCISTIVANDFLRQVQVKVKYQRARGERGMRVCSGCFMMLVKSYR